MTYYNVGADAIPLQNIRSTAIQRASDSAGIFTLVWYKKDGTSGLAKYLNHDELMDAYARASDDQASYNYVAAFSRDPVAGQGTYPAPYQEFGEAIKTAVVRSSADPRSPTGNSKWGWILGGVAATAGFAAISRRKHR